MVLGTVQLPTFSIVANAEEGDVATAETPSVTAYATAEQLKVANNFTLCTDNGTGVAQKVNFGTNGSFAQTWYIAGYEKAQKVW